MLPPLNLLKLNPSSKQVHCFFLFYHNLFQITNAFVIIAEELLIPYSWGRYDILVLPGSFPYVFIRSNLILAHYIWGDTMFQLVMAEWRYQTFPLVCI
jgi:hypothetical protein